MRKDAVATSATLTLLALSGQLCEVALSGNLYATSKVYFDSSNQFSQKGYEVLSLRAEWTDPSDKYTVAVFGDNVTDNKYRIQADAGPFGVASVWAYPATIGLSVRARF